MSQSYLYGIEMNITAKKESSRPKSQSYLYGIEIAIE